MKSDYDSKMASYKRDSDRQRKTDSYNKAVQEMDDLLTNNKDVINEMVRCLNLAATIKMYFWGGLKDSQQDVKTFYRNKDTYEPANMEGVAYSDQDGNIVKIVDRSEFSYRNRNADYNGGF